MGPTLMMFLTEVQGGRLRLRSHFRLLTLTDLWQRLEEIMTSEELGLIVTDEKSHGGLYSFFIYVLLVM